MNRQYTRKGAGGEAQPCSPAARQSDSSKGVLGEEELLGSYFLPGDCPIARSGQEPPTVLLTLDVYLKKMLTVIKSVLRK